MFNACSGNKSLDFLLTISKCLKNAIFDKITDRYLTGLEAHLTDTMSNTKNPDMKRVHVRTSQRMFPSEVKHCIQTNWAGSQSTNVWYVTVFDLKELRGESIWVEVCRQASVLSATLEPCSQTISLPHLTYFWGNRICNEKIVCTWFCGIAQKDMQKYVYKNPSDNKMHTRKVHAEHHQSILIGWKRMQMQTKVCYISIMNVQLLTYDFDR